MTEAEWLACTDPQPMLAFLRDRTSDRKLRLFAVACCRRIAHRIPDAAGRRLVELAEGYAEGLVRKKDLEAARLAAARRAETPERAHTLQESAASWAVVGAADDNAQAAAEGAAGAAREASLSPLELQRRSQISRAWSPDPEAAGVDWKEVWGREGQAQCALIREVFGSLPFRHMKLDRLWFEWRGGTVKKLAQTIYHERAFDRLPILADALEDAGCDNADILNHCRQPGEHVRGCWVVDLVLDKK